MKLEGTPAGLEAQLRSTGLGRFFSAAFMSVWLIGWTVGEVFALGILIAGAWSLMTGHSPGAGRAPLQLEAAAPVGLFLLFWLTFWTFGGVMAGRELLRLLFGRDRIRVRSDAVEIERGYGLFRSRQTFKRDELRRFYCQAGTVALWVETAGGTKELTRLGSATERAELAQALNAELDLKGHLANEGALPENWCEAISLEREPVLIINPVTRRKQAIVMWIASVLIGSLALYIGSGALHRPDLWVPTLVLLAFAGASTWGAVWLSFGRDEWRLEKGRLVLQRRFGANRTTRFEATSLELVEQTSDDTSYQLFAVAAEGRPQSYLQRVDKHHRTIYSQTHDPTEPRKFGQWLSHRCQLPFADLSSAEAKARQIEALKQHLASSGRMGQVTLRIIERLSR